MELCSCRDWAVNLDMSRVKAKNNEIGLFRRETTREVFCFQKEGKKKPTTRVLCTARNLLFSFTHQYVQFTLAVHLGSSVVHTAFKEKTFSHKRHLAYTWKVFSLHISINEKNNYFDT